ncbi:uncharacterized protein [Diadema antillarum]|uniref:uncharacterized protein n=1 Tax=Diadema antillarum TaxID=105358 RepID=UPI003A835150
MVMDETPPLSIENGDPKWRAELKEGLQKLKELTPWSNSLSAELVKGIGALYWGHDDKQQDIANTFCELGGAELFINMLLELTKKGLFSSNTNWQIAFYIYNTLWNFSDASLSLALRLGEKGMVRLCTTNISHKPYRENMDQKNIQFLIKASLNILHNLAKAPGNRHLYREEHVAEKMEPFLEDDPYLKAIGMMTLAYIVEEGQEEILAEKGTNTIEYLVEILKEAQGAKDKRCQGLSDTEVAAGLARLAVHDNNKKKIIEAGGLPLLVSMLHAECLEAQEAAVKALWNLAFSDDVVNELQSNPDCLKALKDLSCSQSAEIAKAANGALWVINKEAEKKEREETGRIDSGTKSFQGKKPHIMISYQWDSQKEVLDIWKALKHAEYEVWIDVDCMYGSTLQAMAEAVENSCAMLMCMSERYKESPNCRTEAEYAFTRRKHIIPIMMEEHYQPDGWLGIILGAKFYMDFSGRLNKDDEMQKLIKEVNIHCPMAKKSSDRSDSLDAPGKPLGSITFSVEDASKSAAPSCLEWSAGQVQDWLAENELDILRGSMVDYNGRLLYRLHKLKKEAPEFFYTSIKEDLGLLKLIDILRFTEALDSLIQD